MMGLTLTAEEKKRIEREDAKMRARLVGVKSEKEDKSKEDKARLESEARRKKRAPFNFEKVSPVLMPCPLNLSREHHRILGKTQGLINYCRSLTSF